MLEKTYNRVDKYDAYQTGKGVIQRKIDIRTLIKSILSISTERESYPLL